MQVRYVSRKAAIVVSVADFRMLLLRCNGSQERGCHVGIELPLVHPSSQVQVNGHLAGPLTLQKSGQFLDRAVVYEIRTHRRKVDARQIQQAKGPRLSVLLYFVVQAAKKLKIQ